MGAGVGVAGCTRGHRNCPQTQACHGVSPGDRVSALLRQT
ncbi:C16orf92 isoform 1 [Pan troglodytes]|uniref:C16orf92 isoform 1 n=1 Tax=Pan troglodytes TaxID=9598 RepID=A0A2J8IST9_PANTR|nr:C16orf92 isoform 1 [Pan troglodytes]